MYWHHINNFSPSAFFTSTNSIINIITWVVLFYYLVKLYIFFSLHSFCLPLFILSLYSCNRISWPIKRSVISFNKYFTTTCNSKYGRNIFSFFFCYFAECFTLFLRRCKQQKKGKTEWVFKHVTLHWQSYAINILPVRGRENFIIFFPDLFLSLARSLAALNMVKMMSCCRISLFLFWVLSHIL